MMKTLPKLKKADLRDEERVRDVMEQALALVDEALASGEVVQAYKQLGPLVDWELTDRPYVILTSTYLEELYDRWRGALNRIHEARYGFTPEQGSSGPLPEEVFPELDASQRDAVFGVIEDIVDAAYMDDASFTQFVNEVYRVCSDSDIGLDKKQVTRLTAYVEGYPIPP